MSTIQQLLSQPELLEQEILKLPRSIEEAEKQAADAKYQMEQSKAELERSTAHYILSSDKPNATEKKAYATQSTVSQQDNYLKSKHYYELKMASLTALNNKFTALRKVASLELELNK
jgi:hypothetical protein